MISLSIKLIKILLFNVDLKEFVGKEDQRPYISGLTDQPTPTTYIYRYFPICLFYNNLR